MSMKKSALIGVLLMGCCATACGALPHAEQPIPVKDSGQAPAANVSPVAGQFGLLQQAMARVRANYVRPVEDNEMIDGAIQGMVSNLDPHSSYLNAKTYSNMLTAYKGEFGGIGLVMEADGGLIKVLSTKDGSPGAKAGIKADDRISAIDGVSVDGADFDESIDKLRGPVGSHVTLTVLRGDNKKPFEVPLVRAIVAVDAVTWRREGDIGYVQVPGFNEKTADGVESAVRDLKKQIGPALKGYVLDLRDNPGGLVDQAVKVSDDFLEAGEIVSIRGRSAQNIQRYSAKAGDITGGKPIVVLINGGTASASEIVSGALQDNKRATVIGMTSFGKGSVQTNIPLGVGLGALHLTTARYYTPSGHSIQARGIIPDVQVAQGDEKTVSKEADLRNHLSGETVKPTAAAVIKPAPGKTYHDFQLSYAEDVLRGAATMAVR